MIQLSSDETQLDSWEIVLLRSANKISLSPKQYELISDRYDQLRGILNAATDPLLKDAHIFVQGSIRLKTAIKPAPEAKNELATIDADAVIWLPNAGTADADTVLKAIEKRFGEGVRVETPIKPLRRGIRIVYADENPGFHIDVTPAKCTNSNNANNGEGNLEVPDREIGWKASSPIPYSDWLEAVANQQIHLRGLDELAKRHVVSAEASQDPIPDYDDYIDANPLRATIKLLKRHRDEWAIRTKNEDVRPISAVLTTLATKAYAELAKESATAPLRPIQAIIEIVERMAKFIHKDSNGFQVCNPMDSQENFAEKWNRPGQEGINYKRAFDNWHIAAKQDIRLGLNDFGSTAAFQEAMNERFGIPKILVEAVAKDLPGHWTLPGRKSGVTANTQRLSALVGGTVASNSSQSAIKPVDRLG